MSQVFGVRRFITAPLNLLRKYILPNVKEQPDPDKQKTHGGRISRPNKCERVGHHRWRFHYRSRMKPSIGHFYCARCPATTIAHIKNKHGDKINVRRSDRPKSQGGTAAPVTPERKAA